MLWLVEINVNKGQLYNGIIGFYSLEFMYISKLTSFPSYSRFSVRNTLLFFYFKIFWQINDLTPYGVGIYEIRQSW